MIESKSGKMRISAPAHPSATDGRVSGLVYPNPIFKKHHNLQMRFKHCFTLNGLFFYIIFIYKIMGFSVSLQLVCAAGKSQDPKNLSKQRAKRMSVTWV